MLGVQPERGGQFCRGTDQEQPLRSWPDCLGRLGEVTSVGCVMYARRPAAITCWSGLRSSGCESLHMWKGNAKARERVGKKEKRKKKEQKEILLRGSLFAVAETSATLTTECQRDAFMADQREQQTISVSIDCTDACYCGTIQRPDTTTPSMHE